MRLLLSVCLLLLLVPACTLKQEPPKGDVSSMYGTWEGKAKAEGELDCSLRMSIGSRDSIKVWIDDVPWDVQLLRCSKAGIVFVAKFEGGEGNRVHVKRTFSGVWDGEVEMEGTGVVMTDVLNPAGETYFNGPPRTFYWSVSNEKK
jgi:hypothetical protein